MSFLRRLFQPTASAVAWPSPGPITEWPAGGASFSAELGGRLFDGRGGQRVDVVGEQHYQDAIEVIAGGRTPTGARYPDDHVAFLMPEPDNPKDAKAIRVWVMDPSGSRLGFVGHLSRADARAYRPMIDRLARQGKLLGGRATVTGGWDRGAQDLGFYGIVLDLPSPAALKLKLDAADGLIPAAHAPIDGRPYANTKCPYCSIELDPLPKANKRCPSCRQLIRVRNGPDGLRYLLQEVDVAVLDAAWDEALAKQSNEEHRRTARGDLRELRGDDYSAVTVEVGVRAGEQACAACVALGGQQYPIGKAPQIPPTGCTCRGGCECEYEPVI